MWKINAIILLTAVWGYNICLLMKAASKKK